MIFLHKKLSVVILQHDISFSDSIFETWFDALIVYSGIIATYDDLVSVLSEVLLVHGCGILQHDLRILTLCQMWVYRRILRRLLRHLTMAKTIGIR